jgi:predicted DCC family thiol-disulfide oxidoreductase YuxK
MTDQTLLIYDGECGFCRWAMHVIERLDRREVFRYCPFGHPVAESFLAGLDPGVRYESFHAVRDGSLRSATAAARITLEQLPLGGLAVALGLHHLYPVVARHRGLLGRLVSARPLISTCPDGPLGAQHA